MDLTTEEENLKNRVKALEELLWKIDNYLDSNSGISHDSMAHRDIKMALGRTQYGERVIYQDERNDYE